MDEIQALMEETPAGGNPEPDLQEFSRSAGVQVYSREWASRKGMTSDRIPADSTSTLNHTEVAALAADDSRRLRLRSRILERMGVSELEFRLASTPGGYHRPEVRAATERLDAALLRLSEQGGRITDTARVLGWSCRSRGGRTYSPRASKCLRRARKRRAEQDPTSAEGPPPA